MAPTSFPQGPSPLSRASYEDDKSTVVSARLRDDANSSDLDEQSIPDFVLADFSEYDLAVTQQGLVYWKDDRGTQHPRGWHIHRKLYDSFLVILFEFVATVFSNTGSACAKFVAEEQGISEVMAIFCFTTLYLIGQAIGSLVLPPYTESFGRRPSYIIACASYSISCVLVAATDHIAGVIVGRLLSGFVSALPCTVACGSLEDMWDVRARIWAFNIFIVLAVMGLGVGPPVATYIATSPLGWRWTFWIAAILAAAITVLALFLRESRASTLLRTRMKRIAKKHRNTSTLRFRPLIGGDTPSFTTFISDSLTRPARLFLTEPIVMSISLICSVVFGTIYLFTEAINVIYVDGFSFNTRQSSLVNLTFTVGPIFSMLPRIYDMHTSNRQRRKNVRAVPEDKLFGFFLAAPLLTIASWYFAWTIPPMATVSPFVSISALVVVGFAASEFLYVLSGYLTDTYGAWAASANAPQAIIRAILSGATPLFGTAMFKNIGNNGAASILAGIATAYCAVAFCFWKFGKRVREHSKFAVHANDTMIVDSVANSSEGV